MPNSSEKAVNASLFFLEQKIRYATITKIFKLLWYSDCKHLERVGIPIFNFHYKAWPYGPVPIEIADTWKKDEKWAVPDQFSNRLRIFNPSIEIDESEPNRNEFRKIAPANTGIFTPFEIEVMKEIAYTYKDTKPGEISDMTHAKGSPWDITWKQKGKGADIDLTICLPKTGTISKDQAIHLMAERDENIRYHF